GDVVADEERHQHEIRLEGQCLFSQDCVIFPRSRSGDAKVVNFGPGTSSLDQREVIVGERHGGSDREGIAESGDAIDTSALLVPEFSTRIAQAIAAKAAAVIASRSQADRKSGG